MTKKNSFKWENRYEFPAQTKSEAISYLTNAIDQYGRIILFGSSVTALEIKGQLIEYALANKIPFNQEEIIKDLKQKYGSRFDYSNESPWESSEIGC